MIYFYFLLTKNFLGCKIIFVFKLFFYVVHFFFVFMSYTYIYIKFSKIKIKLLFKLINLDLRILI